MLIKFTSQPFDPRICVITTLKMYLSCTRGKHGDNKARALVHSFSFWKNNYVQAWIDGELFQPQHLCCSTSKASVYTVPLDKILSTPGSGVQPPHLLSFTTNLLMLIMILQKMFGNCRLGCYCVIDTLQSVLCCRIWILH